MHEDLGLLIAGVLSVIATVTYVIWLFTSPVY